VIVLFRGRRQRAGSPYSSGRRHHVPKAAAGHPLSPDVSCPSGVTPKPSLNGLPNEEGRGSVSCLGLSTEVDRVLVSSPTR
jgi:hypothetical protein